MKVDEDLAAKDKREIAQMEALEALKRKSIMAMAIIGSTGDKSLKDLVHEDETERLKLEVAELKIIVAGKEEHLEATSKMAEVFVDALIDLLEGEDET